MRTSKKRRRSPPKNARRRNCFWLFLTLSLLFAVVHSQQDPPSRLAERRAARERRSQQRQENKERFEHKQRESRQRRQEQWEKWKEFEPSFNVTKAYEAFGVVFSTETPRDLVQGFRQALQSVFIGASIGATALVLFPAALWAHASAREEEVEAEDGSAEAAELEQDATPTSRTREKLPALLVGLLVGSITGSAATGMGILHGSLQLLQGAWNTPTAIQQGWMEKQTWDPYSQTWILIYSLQQEQELVASYQSQWIADSTFYNLLGVPEIGASTRDIKKAYKKLALQWHPDKNPNNAQAAQKFIELTTAYQTLVDDEKRELYDQSGFHQGNDSDEWAFNIPVFFEILFGSQLVEPYVGTLTISTFVSQLVAWYRSSTNNSSPWSLESILVWRDESVYARRKRQVEIASNLLQRVENYNEQSIQEFFTSCQTEALEVSTTAGFGDHFLIAIGDELQLQANAILAPWWQIPWYVTLQSYRHANLTAHSLYQTGQLFWDLMQQSEEVTGGGNGESSTKQKRRISAETIQKMLPDLMDVAWARTRADLSSTFRGACKRLFDDASSRQEKVRRAQALQILGQEFVRQARESSSSGKKSDSTKEEEETACADLEAEMKARLEVAFQLAQTQQHKQGQAMTSKESEEMIQKARRPAGGPLPTIKE